MVAAFAATAPQCLLVIVPTDALRTQISEKFESLGVLKRKQLLPASCPYPRVARVTSRIRGAAAVEELVSQSNVIVSTAAAMARLDEDTRDALRSACQQLYVDEAHHIPATTWQKLRDGFHGRPILQFTATPYRRDGKRIGGEIIYAFPLREAQIDNYFSPIRYRGVFDLVQPDRAVAKAAIAQLRDDVSNELDHILMARAAQVSKARELLSLYQEMAAEFAPVLIVSGGGSTSSDRTAAFGKVDRRESRIIVCVDMLGEGYDLANLKVAALHDPHRSLGITLQFIGRFARAAPGQRVGDATIIAPRNEVEHDTNLRRLYAEDADWNQIIHELSSAAIGAEREIDEFNRGFTQSATNVTIRSVAPKMSCVAYKTECNDWNLPALERMFPESRLLTHPMSVNFDRRVIWFISEEKESVQWGESAVTEDVSHDLYAIYWDEVRGFLYINCSENSGLYKDIAEGLCGTSVSVVNGDPLYRTLARIDRPVPTNIGVLDTRNRNRRFSSHVGADVTEGLPAAQSDTKTQTNIFVTGYQDGEKIGGGISLKGRIWRRQAATSLQQWVRWCDHIGTRLLDDTADVSQIIQGFIRPQPLDSWPELAVLAVEWPLEIALDINEQHRLSLDGKVFPLLEIELSVDIPEAIQPVVVVSAPSWRVEYSVSILNDELHFQPLDSEARFLTTRTDKPLSAVLNDVGLRFVLVDDAVIEPPGFLLRPDRALEPFDRGDLVVLDWTGTNIRKESQTSDRDRESIQFKMLDRLVSSEMWDIVIDDDGSGEIADCVSIAIRDDSLVIRLTHCKYSSEDNPGARVGDLYEVCGQAMKSGVIRRDVPSFFAKLIKRERQRRGRGAPSGFILGTPDELLNIRDAARLLRPILEVEIVQPGVSADAASISQLNILGGAEVYLRETANASLVVICSA